MRRAAIACALLAACAFAREARADAVDACVEAADRAQQLRDQGKLIDARAQLIACGVATCPGAVAKQCAKWLREVDDELPTVSLRVRDPSGADVADVQVDVDGAKRLATLDGRPLPLDPGPHRLVFTRNGATAEESLVVRAGEKNRLVDVTLKAPASAVVVTTAPPPAPVVEQRSSFRFPASTGVLLGVSVASFVGTAVLVALASNDASTMRSTCAPTCPQSDVDAAHTKLVAANVTFGVGVASIALAVVFLVTANVGHHGKRASAPPMTITF